MALQRMIAVLLFALAISKIKVSMSQVVRGKVSCLDCSGHYNFSGIVVQVKCVKVQKSSMSEAEVDGNFEAKLPTDTTSSSRTTSPATFNCLAKLVGGPNKLYATRTNMVSKIVKDQEDYKLSNPLAFYTKCPLGMKKYCSTNNRGSKTIDLPLPREWGFAPSSLYFPFFPIIGIP